MNIIEINNLDPISEAQLKAYDSGFSDGPIKQFLKTEKAADFRLFEKHLNSLTSIRSGNKVIISEVALRCLVGLQLPVSCLAIGMVEYFTKYNSFPSSPFVEDQSLEMHQQRTEALRLKKRLFYRIDQVRELCIAAKRAFDPNLALRQIAKDGILLTDIYKVSYKVTITANKILSREKIEAFRKQEMKWPHSQTALTQIKNNGFVYLPAIDYRFLRIFPDFCVCDICKVAILTWNEYDDPTSMHDFTKHQRNLRQEAIPPVSFSAAIHRFVTSEPSIYSTPQAEFEAYDSGFSDEGITRFLNTEKAVNFRSFHQLLRKMVTKRVASVSVKSCFNFLNFEYGCHYGTLVEYAIKYNPSYLALREHYLKKKIIWRDLVRTILEQKDLEMYQFRKAGLQLKKYLFYRLDQMRHYCRKSGTRFDPVRALHFILQDKVWLEDVQKLWIKTQSKIQQLVDRNPKICDTLMQHLQQPGIGLTRAYSVRQRIIDDGFVFRPRIPWFERFVCLTCKVELEGWQEYDDPSSCHDLSKHGKK